MKKAGLLLAAFLLLGGCSAPAAQTNTTPVSQTTTAAAETADWGVTLRLENEQTTGAVLVLERGEGSDEINCGSDYVLEQLVDGVWQAVPQKDPDMDIAWTAEAYMIPANGAQRLEVNWEWIYGSLPAGQYRVGKSAMIFRGPGDFDTAMLYAEFAVIE